MTIQSIHHLFRLLDEADWYASSGQPVPDADVRVLTSWDDVFPVVEDDYTEYYLLEQANLIRDAVTTRSMDAYRAWGEFADGIRPEVEDVVTHKLTRPDLGHAPLKSLLDHLNWIVVHAAIEVYYRRHASRDFFQTMTLWLTRGHLPLSWENGDYPHGRAVIY